MQIPSAEINGRMLRPLKERELSIKKKTANFVEVDAMYRQNFEELNEIVKTLREEKGGLERRLRIDETKVGIRKAET